MHFLGIGLPCRPLSDPQAEVAVVLLDTRGTVLAAEWRGDLEAVVALTAELADGDTLIAAGAPLCGLPSDARSHAAVQALRHRLALTDVDSGVLECDADTFPFPTDEFEGVPWPVEVCGHGRRTLRRLERLAHGCDDLARRLGLLVSAHPPVDLHSNEVTAALLTTRTGRTAADVEHRTALVGALLCAWAASCWHESPEQRARSLDDLKLDVPLAG
jgi:predicted RNase H-like nuclease